jgi:hypothetical protein
MINSALTRACLSDQVGEVYHQVRRVSVQGLGFCETNAFAKFFVPQEALEVSKRMTEKSLRIIIFSIIRTWRLLSLHKAMEGSSLLRTNAMNLRKN